MLKGRRRKTAWTLHPEPYPSFDKMNMEQVPNDNDQVFQQQKKLARF